ncbi:nickel-responsive regulator [candidate division WOR-1 bacterium DG_54_3]|uniref:Putative nickel-responsive regulator n=1 Tax=candidate division WOR-1 bacterium DG_54_3 TaxID=1703775 RepID=A0A0S7Y1J6_UNCSA|nr:MAG: nickel-responsive regulator [candidate division WOR-1 bacterium DG_54_3]
MNKLKVARFGVSMDPELRDKFDRLIGQKGYANRSEAVRDLVREHLVEKEWQEVKGEVVGTVTLIYDHHVHDLSDKLTDLQHDHYRNIISSTHIHLDGQNCLEVLVVKGKSSQVRAIAERLMSTKGVKHGKLAMTSTGKELK